MKKIVLLMLFFMLTPLGFSFAQDNIYGDYSLGISKKVISLDLENANLVDVLKMLSQQTGLNFISTEAVKERKITLYLDNTPLKEAMDLIFKANNLTYDYYPDANMFVVKEMGKPAVELVTKVYPLRYVRVVNSRLQKEIINVMEPQSTQTGQTQTGAAGATGTASQQEQDIERGVRGAVKKMLTEFGKVSEDPITNSIIVTDVPSQIPLIDELVRKLDVPLPLVMIETEMLDVSKRAIDKLGVNWPEALIKLGVTGTKHVSFPFPEGTTVPEDSYSVIYEKGAFGSAGMMMNGLAISAPGWPAQRFTPTILTVLGTDLVLNYLKSLVDTKSLARPKIMTVSNETAEIKITTNEAIGVTKTEASGGAGSTTFTIDREETGTKLRVTPQVDPETGEITLFVETTVKEAKDSGFTFTSTTFVSGTIKNPEERSATAVARLKDGQTLLMGGLIKKEGSNQKTKLPILGDIPIIGNAFRWKFDDQQERELLVFLTPHIVGNKPVLAEGGGFSQREQGSFKRESMRVALDRYSR